MWQGRQARLTRLVVIMTTVAFAAGTAEAAETVGSELTQPADGAAFSGPGTVAMSAAAPGSTLPITATAAGTIVSVTLKHGASSSPTPATVEPRIMNGSPPTLNSRRHDRFPSFVLPPGVASTDTIVPGDFDSGAPHGVPIEAGERVGLAFNGSGFRLQHATTGASRVENLSSATGTANYGTVADRELLFQYRIEPDVDRDGYGDETQDACPSTKGNCAPLPTGPAVPGPPEPGQTVFQTQRVTTTIACRTGTKPAGDHCAKITCPKGKKLKHGKCVKQKARRKR
jgi:hypothetical protein